MNRRVMIGTAAAIVVIFAAWYMLLWSPQGSDIDKARERQSAAEGQQQELELRVQRLRSAKAHSVELQAERDQFGRAVPDRPDLPQLILDINAMAQESGVAFITITPTPPATSAAAAPAAQAGAASDTTAAPSGVSAVGLNITLKGGYHPVTDFLDRLGELERIVVIDDLALTPAGAEGGLAPPDLSVTLTGRAFTSAAPAGVSGTSPTATAPSATSQPSSSQPTTQASAQSPQGGKS